VRGGESRQPEREGCGSDGREVLVGAQGKREDRAAFGVVFAGESAAVVFDDCAADRQAKAQAVGAGGEEGFEQARKNFGADADAAIDHADAQDAGALDDGSNEDDAFVDRQVVYGVVGVLEEIDQHLLNFNGVAVGGGKMGGQIKFDARVAAMHFGLDQADGLDEGGIKIDRTVIHGIASARESAETVNDLPGALGLLGGAANGFAKDGERRGERRGGIGERAGVERIRGARKAIDGGGGCAQVIHDRSEGLIDFVSKTGRHFADGGDARKVGELSLLFEDGGICEQCACFSGLTWGERDAGAG